MTTKLIGIKEFRANVSRYAQLAQKGKTRYVVMNRTSPLFELTPITNEPEFTEEFIEGIKKGLADIKAGRTYSQEEVLAQLG